MTNIRANEEWLCVSIIHIVTVALVFADSLILGVVAAQQMRSGYYFASICSYFEGDTTATTGQHSLFKGGSAWRSAATGAEQRATTDH